MTHTERNAMDTVTSGHGGVRRLLPADRDLRVLDQLERIACALLIDTEQASPVLRYLATQLAERAVLEAEEQGQLTEQP